MQSRFQHIDAMRAFAVALVVFSHAGLTFVPGGSGVTVFFCISGFWITYTMLRERERTGGFDWGGFYFRRAVKLAPPLVLIIVIPTLIYSLFHRIDWLDFLGQVFFFFNWRYTDSEVLVMPGSVVTWSLSIEEQFYLVIALVWLAAVRWRRADAVLAWVAGGVVEPFQRSSRGGLARPAARHLPRHNVLAEQVGPHGIGDGRQVVERHFHPIEK